MKQQSSIDHCGSCFNTCSDAQTCHKGMCVELQGSGASCSSPFILPADDEPFELRASSFPASRKFTCGPLSEIPTRWYRWNAGTKDDSVRVGIQSSDPADDYVIEVFSSRACDAATALGCNDNEKQGTLLPELELQMKAGQTYFIAVGKVASPSGANAAIRFDD